MPPRAHPLRPGPAALDESEDDARAKIITDVEAAIAAAGGTVSRKQTWGRRPTTFPIRHQSEADYHLLQFTGPTALLESLSHRLRIADEVLRFRIIKVVPGTPEAPASAPPVLVGAIWRAERRTGMRPEPRRQGSARPPRGDCSAVFVTRPRRWRVRIPVHTVTNLSIFRPPGRLTPGPPRLGARPVTHLKGASQMAGNINRVIITGNLTKDPELQTLPSSGTNVCSLRIACNGRRKNNETGQWEDQPNYFDVTVWGQQGENCKRYLTKGRGVAIDGRLRWREWTRHGRGRSARLSISSLRPCSSSAGVMTPVRRTGMGSRAACALLRATSRSIPATSCSAAVGNGAADDDIPF